MQPTLVESFSRAQIARDESYSAETGNPEIGSQVQHRPAVERSVTFGQLLSIFGQSVFYAAVQGPYKGLSQCLRHLPGGLELPRLELVSEPQPQPFGSWRWHAQQVGGAVGMTVPFLFVHKLVGGVGRFGAVGRLGGSAALATRPVLAGGLSITEAATSGFVYDYVFHPTEENESSFWLARARNGLSGAAAFGTLSATGVCMRLRLFKEAAHGFRAFGEEMAINFLGGGLAGVADVGTRSLLHGRRPILTWEDVTQSAYTFSVAGMTLAGQRAVLSRLFRRRAARSQEVDSETADRSTGDLTGASSEGGDWNGAPRTSWPRRTVDSASHAEQQAELLGLSLSLPLRGNLSLPELHQRLGTPEQAMRTFEVLKPRVRGKSNETQEAFRDRALKYDVQDVRVYRPADCPGLEIILPEAYARALDPVRQWRVDADRPLVGAEPFEFQKVMDARAQLERSPFRDRPLPEDVLGQLLLLPDRSIAHRIFLHNRADPMELWIQFNRCRTHKTAASAIAPCREIHFWSNQNRQSLWLTTGHEWAHLLGDLAGPVARLRSAFNDAAHLERKGYFSDPYGRTEVEENWAVHWEDLLNLDGNRFLRFCQEAPYRASLMGRALREVLDNVPSNARSAHHEMLVNRVRHIEENVTPRARQLLEAHLFDPHRRWSTKARAFAVLQSLADPFQIPVMIRLARELTSLELACDAYRVARELSSQGPPGQVNSALAELARQLAVPESRVGAQAFNELCRLDFNEARRRWMSGDFLAQWRRGRFDGMSAYQALSDQTAPHRRGALNEQTLAMTQSYPRLRSQLLESGLCN